MVTQRQLAESVSDLRLVAKDLRATADGEPLQGSKGKAVGASVRGLRSRADFLDRVAEEILTLIDDETPVSVPKDQTPPKVDPEAA